jgi:hypothetical protein
MPGQVTRCAWGGNEGAQATPAVSVLEPAKSRENLQASASVAQVRALTYFSTEPVDDPVGKPVHHDLCIIHNKTSCCLPTFLAGRIHLKSLD